MKRSIVVVAILLITNSISAQTHQLASPNKKLVVAINVDNGLVYSVTKDGIGIIDNSRIALQTNHFPETLFNRKPTINRIDGKDDFKTYWGTTSNIADEFSQITLSYPQNLSVQFRAYNDGVAWRFVTDINEDIIVHNETAEFVIPKESTIYLPKAKGFSTPFEPNYLPTAANSIDNETLAHTPLMFTSTSGKVVVISEANLFEYPGMFLEYTNNNTFKAVFPKYPKHESQEFLGKLHLVKWPQLSRMVVRSTKDYIAKSGGKRDFPWRVIMVADSDLDILSNNLIYQLANKPKMDYSWVKPGKVVWDWYHNWNLQNLPFEPGINTQTYKYKIDFAAKNGIEYVNIDDGWSKLWNFNKINSNLDVNEVIKYANEKGVGIFLWAMWNTIDKDFIANLDKFQQMGIAGLKVDFFDRTDQRMVDFINRLAEECAKRKLLLNLHGMYKPTGISTTYPNVVNLEGVMGLEYNKFSNNCTPEHNLTIPFVRNVVGPMDYTPGSMRYMKPEVFQKSWDNPHSMSTRTQQLAMYVVYHGGVQMLADSPTFYEEDDIALNFLSQVPATWDESVPLVGKIGEVIVIARRHGDKWYVGGMAGTKEQTVKFSLSFLKNHRYKAILIANGDNASDLKTENLELNSNQVFDHTIPALGGFVLAIENVE
jgi:alpha-glucosidase